MYFIGLIFAAAMAALALAFATDIGFRSIPTAAVDQTAQQQLQAYAKKRARDQAAHERQDALDRKQ